MPKYLLLLRISSFFLTFFISAMSLGSNKASSIAEAMWHPMPSLKSLINASSRRGSLPCMGAGNHACGLESWVSDLSWPRWAWCLVFCCFVAHWTSSSWVGRDLQTSTTSLPFCSPRLFNSAASGRTGWGGWWEGWWGAGGGDLVGRDGIWDCVDLAGAFFPGWFSINSIKLLWGFLCIPISSKFSKETESCTTSSSSSSPSFSSLRVGWDEEAPVEIAATKRGSVRVSFSGRGIPSGTMNPL